MSAEEARRPVFVFALIVTLALIALTQVDPTFNGFSAFEPVVWGAVAFVAWRRSSWAAGGAALFLLVFRGFTLAEQVCRFFLQRPLELRNDLRMIPDLQSVLTDTGGHATLPAVALGLGAFFLVVLFALRFVAEQRAALLTVFILSGAFGLLFPAERSLSWRFVSELTSTQDELEARIRDEQQARAAWADLSDRSFRGRDVHLFLIESYGEIVFTHPELVSLRSETLPEFERALNEAALQVSSALYRSPTFGGRSWLAHASIDSGVMVTDQLRYERILQSQVVPLAAHFNRAGYFSATVAPGIVKPYPEGDWFAYRETVYRKDLSYAGPRFGWALVPDQWLVHQVGERLAAGPAPRFVEWHLVSTHAPFNAHAPLLAMEELGGNDPYAGLDPIRFDIRWPYLENAHRGYAHAIEYDLRVLAEALPRLLEDGGVAILVGDHQPNGAMMESGASWNVPCHVVSADAAWPGFHPGVMPSRTEAAPPLSELYEAILNSEATPAMRIGRGVPP